MQLTVSDDRPRTLLQGKKGQYQEAKAFNTLINLPSNHTLHFYTLHCPYCRSNPGRWAGSIDLNNSLRDTDEI
jgi:hypothetical protein